MPPLRTIVCVDPGENAPLAALLARALEHEEPSITVLADPAQALRVLNERPADIMVADCRLGDPESLGLLQAVQAAWPGMPAIVVSDRGATADVVEAIAAGASDVLLGPVSAEQLALAFYKAVGVASRLAAAPPPPKANLGIVFGRSPAMEILRSLIERVAPTSSTVLVRGESGTGKELVARALHRASARAAGPFIKIDCTALPETLIESELFGYEKGAFTGAAAQKVGRVQLADGGTLFLDEIGELPATIQSKLLRLLQDREFERLGGSKTLRVDVRVVAATHRDLEAMVERGSFRQDLFYRLNVVPMWIAPLRARRADIDVLAEHFCAHAAADNGKEAVHLAPEALRALATQRWPGNVRQLQNFVERLVVLSGHPIITAAEVEAEIGRPVRFATETGTVGGDAAAEVGAEAAVPALDEALRAAEKQALVRALEHVGGNRSAAARVLGVSRSTFYAKLRDYGLL
ncbi:MAG TPA: sigma-54 dependent transcriptional regulator [Polyangiaceae bacterium]